MAIWDVLLIAGHPSEAGSGRQQHGPSMLALELAATSADPHTLHFHTCHKRSGKVPRGRKKVMPFLPLLSHFVSRPIRLFREPCAILEPDRVTRLPGREFFSFPSSFSCYLDNELIRTCMVFSRHLHGLCGCTFL